MTMEQHLITLKVWNKVDASDPTVVATAVIRAVECYHALALVGPRGGITVVAGQEVNRFTHENYLVAAQRGMLYAGKDDACLAALAPAVDPETKLPVMMEELGVVLRRRQRAGSEPPATPSPPPQQELPLGK